MDPSPPDADGAPRDDGVRDRPRSRRGRPPAGRGEAGDAPRHPLLDRGRDPARPVGDEAPRRAHPRLLRAPRHGGARHGRADAAALPRAHHGDHRPQLGRQLLGHRRLLRRRPRAARGQGRLSHRLRLRRGGAHQREAFRGAGDPGPQRLVPLHAQDARRDPAAGERGSGARAAPPLRRRREGAPLPGRRDGGRRAHLGDLAARGRAGRPRQRPRLPGAQPGGDRGGGVAGAAAPDHRGPRPRPAALGRARGPLLPLPGARRRRGRGGRASRDRDSHLREGPRGGLRHRGRRAHPRGHRPGEDPHVLGLLGVPALPSRASRPLGRAREGRPEHPPARGDRQVRPGPRSFRPWFPDRRGRSAGSGSPRHRAGLGPPAPCRGGRRRPPRDPRLRPRARGLVRRPLGRGRDRARPRDRCHAPVGLGRPRRAQGGDALRPAPQRHRLSRR